MNEQKNNGRGIFYGVIGVATLVVAIIGATFAYFTATAGNNVITGNMASISLSLDVAKVTTVDETKGGMIPMSNNMVSAALSSSNDVCVDDNGNAVCQIYKITITNDSSAGQFVDGYVALKGGSGIEPTDVKGMTGVAGTDGQTGTYSYVAGALVDAAGNVNKGTTMRWAQVWASGDDYTLTGTQKLGSATAEKVDLTMHAVSLLSDDNSTHNRVNIKTNNTTMATFSGDTNSDGVCTTVQGDNPITSTVEDDYIETGCTSTGDAKGILTPLTISGNSYNVIGTNYIRTSNHTWTEGAQTYKRDTDVTSALVYNHNLAPNTDATNSKAEYYIVVWLSETGTNQTAGATVGEGDAAYTNPGALKFFTGNVTFVSAQGSEVSATFSSYTRVESDQVKNAGE